MIKAHDRALHFLFIFLPFILLNASSSNSIRMAQYMQPISQPQIANGSTLQITVPGYYLLAGNLLFRAAAAETNVIEVLVDDVVLDLNSYSIASDGLKASTSGIFVDTSLSNIIIKNGTVFRLTGTGIDISAGCKNIELYDLILKDCDSAGIAISSSTAGEIVNCVVTQTEGALTSTATYGIFFDSCTSFNIQDSQFTSNNSIAIPANGVYLDSSKNCNFLNCISSANTGTAAYGFHLVSCSSCQFTSCSAVENEGLDGAGFGFAFESCTALQLNLCRAISNSSDTTRAYGFYFLNSDYNFLNNCSALTQSGEIDAYGFYSSGGGGNQFTCCNASGNIGGSFSYSIGSGFTLVGSETRSMIIESESNSNGTTSGTGYGIQFATTGNSVTNCVVRNCKFMSNFGSDQYGFKDFSTNMQSILTNNFAFGQGKVFPLVAGAISDDGDLNYMFTFTNQGQSAANMITETDISTLVTLDTAGPFNNLSIYT